MDLPRMVVTDIDGTLLTDAGAIREETVEALRDLHAAGSILCSASARTPANTRIALGPAVGAFSAFACTNGSHVLTREGDLLLDQRFDEVLVRDVVERAREGRVSFALVSADGMSGRLFDDRVLPGFLLFHPEFVESDGLPMDAKFVALYGDPGPILEMHASLARDGGGVHASEPALSRKTGLRFFFAQPAGSNKGVALRRLCEHFGVSPSETLGIGDGLWNDLPLLEAAGIAVAMKHAADPLKAIADLVTEFDNNEDGAGIFFRRHLLD